MIRPLCLTALAVLASAAALAEGPRFELKSGDRVVFLGNALLERSMPTAYLETILTQAYPGVDVTFRNLAWSGDNVFGHARAGFDNPGVGYRRIEERLTEAKPTVVILSYGMNASFRGEAGLTSFLDGYRKLLALVDKLGARAVHLSPIRHEKLPAPLPDPAEHNRKLKVYVDAMSKLAAERKEVFVDLYRALGDGGARSPGASYTDNGIHLTDYGYWKLARVVGRELGLRTPSWRVDIDVAKDRVMTEGTRVSVSAKSTRRVFFELTDIALPRSPLPVGVAEGVENAAERTLRVQGLAAGRYVVEVGDIEIARASAQELAKGVALTSGPEIERVERMRGTIARKNFLFFCQWRPQNNTYLFLFRKHEQGHLAGEVEDFVPLIETQEKTIAELRKPTVQKYLVRREDAKGGAGK